VPGDTGLDHELLPRPPEVGDDAAAREDERLVHVWVLEAAGE
jgi:hypothetical protein